MEIDWIRDYCLALPHSTECMPWGRELVFKIGGKMYAIAALEPGTHWLSFKCTPETFADLTEREGILPAPYLARAQWVALTEAATLPRSEVKTLLRAAYETVLSKLPRTAQARLRA